MKSKMIAVMATFSLFAIAGAFALSSVVPMTIPVSDPHGILGGAASSIPVSDPHKWSNRLGVVSGSSVNYIPVSDPHCITLLADLSGVYIPVSDPH
ncbi:MAG: hypothetical protein ABSB83_02105 [Methanomassiliicoccales archaeon]|jgi:hypothetical protein